jgi:hypothetical protein
MSTRRRLHVAFLLALLCGACASTPEAPEMDDATAKHFEAAPQSAIIYLYREDGPSEGVATLWLDGRLVGQSLHNTYFRANVRPGHNIITASGQDTGRIEIDTRPDSVYFVAVNVLGRSEGASKTVFRSVPLETGKSAILKCCTLLETWRPGQWRANF